MAFIRSEDVERELIKNGYQYFDSYDDSESLRNKWNIGSLWFCDRWTAYGHLQDQREIKRLRQLVGEDNDGTN